MKEKKNLFKPPGFQLFEKPNNTRNVILDSFSRAFSIVAFAENAMQ